jgi:2-(3-amino-3-carboxypropyl)histidine synthase
MNVLLQFPEGLKKLALKEARALESKGHTVFVSSSFCFGACDLALDEARAIGAKKIIHWGHTDFFVKTKIPVEYREYPIKIDAGKAASLALHKLKAFKKIGIVTTAQHAGQLKELKQELEKGKKSVFIGKSARAKYPGQVLGCDASAATSILKKVECFVYFGGGLFHPLMDIEKPVLRVDPFSLTAEWMDKEILLAKKARKGAMNSFALAKRVGILVSTKPGQMQMAQAQAIKKQMEKHGKECLLLVSNFVDFSAIRNFGEFDCFVNTACPRLQDDFAAAGKPIINFQDAIYVMKLLGEKR